MGGACDRHGPRMEAGMGVGWRRRHTCHTQHLSRTCSDCFSLPALPLTGQAQAVREASSKNSQRVWPGALPTRPRQCLFPRFKYSRCFGALLTPVLHGGERGPCDGRSMAFGGSIPAHRQGDLVPTEFMAMPRREGDQHCSRTQRPTCRMRQVTLPVSRLVKQRRRSAVRVLAGPLLGVNCPRLENCATYFSGEGIVGPWGTRRLWGEKSGYYV
ncbi:hypothetical protein DFH27DRAFT_537028 [Peziza echinospora]|nr:hypothetical protein DFH27DRAFT_537028 [Peziza echinospora]